MGLACGHRHMCSSRSLELPQVLEHSNKGLTDALGIRGVWKKTPTDKRNVLDLDERGKVLPPTQSETR